MAIFRNIQMSFWTDTKIIDEFTPEDKFFYLYLFTNPHTNLCGCYEIGKKQMAMETGYSVDTIDSLLERFVNVHKVIKYSSDTKEVLILNWHKYNWSKSSKVLTALEKEIANIKEESFKLYCIDMVSIHYAYTMDIPERNTDTDTDTDTVSVTDTEKEKEKEKENLPVEEIIDYLNERTGKHYKPNVSKTRTLIHARCSEGFTLQDFRTVIDKMCVEWSNTEFEKFLRPETLFGTKFEGYLNRSVKERVSFTERVARGDFHDY